jgi:Zn-finger nucleic acid-binding protein
LILLGDFLRWQELNPESDFDVEAEVGVVAEETTRAMICPLSGTIMTKYRISADTEHRLDLSPTINAVWLDKGEWSLLKEKGLAKKLNQIFTNHWQRGVRDTETSEMLDELYARRFGGQYEQIKAFKNVIEQMENRSEIVAYLLSD